MRKDGLPRYGAWITTALLLSLFSLGEPSMARSYLQELENEAAATGGEHSDNANKPGWTPRQTSLIEKIDAGLNKDQFEETLKSRFYGSYVFYSALEEKKQQRVYEEYQVNNDIDHLRETIKQQMSK